MTILFILLISCVTCDRFVTGVASTPRRLSAAEQVSDGESSSLVPCPGHHTYCRNDQTCCENTSGGYGCCPFPNAVCCLDRIHCCPSTKICDLSALACVKPHQSVSARSFFQSLISDLPPV
ncbi:granulins-like [Plakobranchus ocellatus]|uniref:Granulins-like n=1 Tax=Plakobranchus ocellatus TaxID=259542 RepID=A0AAV4AXL8_9GAST|nr:granulins-like [Plakobranchus ocellatus]